MQQKKFEHKGKVYIGTRHDGKVKVATERTAKKQLINLAVYDIQANSWQEICKGQKLPNIVKHGFETAFGSNAI